MKKYLSLIAAAGFLFSCETKESEIDYTQLSDAERLELAQR
jgi:membrane dipeptidase